MRGNRLPYGLFSALVIAVSCVSSTQALGHTQQRQLLRQSGVRNEDEGLLPKMTVMILTARRKTKTTRDVMRRQWHQVDKPRGQICMRFVLCKSSDVYEHALHAEQAEMGDLIFLDCQEGYAHGLLTKKTAMSLQAFLQPDDPCLNRDLFMKVDDDTFVNGHKFRSMINTAWRQHGDAIFAGLPCDAGEAIRDPTSRWYEPASLWPHDYPAAMYGGPGYVIGRSLVDLIISTGVSAKYMLWNEDRAVGVWIGQLQNQGIDVNWVSLPGTNGYRWDESVTSGQWAQYPFALHHHLDPVTISCLSDLDKANNPMKYVDVCFLSR